MDYLKKEYNKLVGKKDKFTEHDVSPTTQSSSSNSSLLRKPLFIFIIICIILYFVTKSCSTTTSGSDTSSMRLGGTPGPDDSSTSPGPAMDR